MGACKYPICEVVPCQARNPGFSNSHVEFINLNTTYGSTILFRWLFDILTCQCFNPDSILGTRSPIDRAVCTQNCFTDFGGRKPAKTPGHPMRLQQSVAGWLRVDPACMQGLHESLVHVALSGVGGYLGDYLGLLYVHMSSPRKYIN